MQPSLGEFEQIVCLAILRLGEEAYGATIHDEIAACTGRTPSPGALYTTLDRLEEKRFVVSLSGESRQRFRLLDRSSQDGYRAQPKVGRRYSTCIGNGVRTHTSVQP